MQTKKSRTRRPLLRTLGLCFFTVVSLLFVGSTRTAAEVLVDKEKRTVSVPVKVAPRKINDEKFKEVYPVEVIATWPYPKGRKAHETVVTFEVAPSQVHQALVSLGVQPGKPARAAKDVASGPEVKMYFEVPTAGGKATRRIPLEKVLVDKKTKKPMPKIRWLFTGSMESNEGGKKEYGADVTGTLIAIFPVTAETVFQSSLTLAEERFVKLETDTEVLPPVGTAMRLVIVAPPAK